MPTIEVTRDDEHLIINKSSKLKANHSAPRNCTTKSIKQCRKRIIINQSHKSEQHQHRNVIDKKKKKNVLKSCMPVTKSLNNDRNCLRRQPWWQWLWREIESLRVSLNQHLYAKRLNQLLRFDGILIFITAISQQGEPFFLFTSN